MKKYVFASLLAATAMLAACDSGPFASTDAMRQHAAQSLAQKNFGAAASQAEKLSAKAPDDYEAFYLLAQAQAQLGNKNAALAALESAIKKGYKDEQAIAANDNLQSLRNMSAYAELMDSAFPRRVQAGTAETPAAASDAVGITETAGKTVIRAGDVVVEMPKTN
ncbi:tetratricopeptide repeat protein [Pseudoduganella aquatica]|uniref:Tetratricopeptide repeat protein n=1 Tax=Pseudoduganella aquatica TaxID=2660641 RepID=A0A7X4HIY9_9BURK|nr:tetratricopeptide repeat protein [Pseudoduganella aquatica]MYN11342.1 tetratricopeptide repeat protein [Pseudoduganella aquatica]